MGNFSKFAFTPTGRFKRDATGRCMYEIPVPVIPSSVRGDHRRNQYPKGYVAPDDGEDCPLYCEKK